VSCAINHFIGQLDTAGDGTGQPKEHRASPDVRQESISRGCYKEILRSWPGGPSMVKCAPRRRTSATQSSDSRRPTGREVIGFIEKFLCIPDGPHAGQPLILAPWQKQEIHRIYDHRVRRSIISTPKKNGKTGLCAALLLNALVGPSARNHRNARLYSSAMSRDQAALTFDAARKMILLNNDLRQAVSIKESAKVLRNDELGIEYKALSSEAHRAQGLNPSLHIADELGEVIRSDFKFVRGS
jgi:phage terminase large subunit-like protein